MSLEMRSAIVALATGWQKRGHGLGFGVGIAHGFATLGCIGFPGRQDYSAIGSVVNRAARLCSEAESGQILIDGRMQAAVELVADVAAAGNLSLKGFRHAPGAFALTALRDIPGAA